MSFVTALFSLLMSVGVYHDTLKRVCPVPKVSNSGVLGRWWATASGITSYRTCKAKLVKLR